MAKLSMDALFKILAATLTGMSVDQFQAEVKHWLDTDRDPRWNRRRHRSRRRQLEDALAP
jgi:hypothetical protein